MLILDEVPPPPWSDGTTYFFPTNHQSARTPLATFVECESVRLQKFLDRLSPAIKEAYVKNPEKLPGVDPEKIKEEDGVKFSEGAVLRRFPKNYMLFESRRIDRGSPTNGGTPGTPPTGDGEEIGRARSDAYVFGHPSKPFHKAKAALGIREESGPLVYEPTNFARHWLDPRNFGAAPGDKVVLPNFKLPILPLIPAGGSSPDPSRRPPELGGSGCGGSGGASGGGISPKPESPSSSAVEPKWQQSGGPSALVPAGEHSSGKGSLKRAFPEEPSPHPSDASPAPSESEGESRSRRSHKHKQKKASKDSSERDAHAEMKYKKKYKELKRKIHEVEEENMRLQEEYDRSKKKIARLKVEKG
ncbi:hypothetical protein HK104_003655, partial [Borealophlyctis nickersoniae]